MAVWRSVAILSRRPLRPERVRVLSIKVCERLSPLLPTRVLHFFSAWTLPRSRGRRLSRVGAWRWECEGCVEPGPEHQCSWLRHTASELGPAGLAKRDSGHRPAHLSRSWAVSGLRPLWPRAVSPMILGPGVVPRPGVCQASALRQSHTPAPLKDSDFEVGLC